MNPPEHIVIITPIYPSPHRMELGTFTQVLARNLVRLGVKTTVIAPTKFWVPGAELSDGRTGSVDLAEPVVRRPAYLPFSRKRMPIFGSTYRWTVRAFTRAVDRIVQDLDPRPTHLYGQFLFPAGYAAAGLANKMGIRSAIAIGEAAPLNLQDYDRDLGAGKVRQALGATDSIIAAADHLERRCIDNYEVPESKIAVFKNAAAPHFAPLDRSEARTKLGLPRDRAIIGFVGAFQSTKRPWHVLEAISDRPDIGAFFLGHPSSRPPSGDQVLFAGPVPHEQVPLWLSAADVFVHASLDEGTSNAVAEAKACGLPVVATNIKGNQELLDPEYAILVDPLDVDTMKRGICRLIDDDELRNKMSAAALKSARAYTSLDRARNIVTWLGSR